VNAAEDVIESRRAHDRRDVKWILDHLSIEHGLAQDFLLGFRAIFTRAHHPDQETNARSIIALVIDTITGYLVYISSSFEFHRSFFKNASIIDHASIKTHYIVDRLQI
jgi:hypothetical protein